MTGKVSIAWKWASALIAALAVFLVVDGHFKSVRINEQRAENNSLQAALDRAGEVVSQQEQATETSDRAQQKAAEGRAKAAEVTSKEQEKVTDALKRAPEWAAEPIPAAVLDSLRN